jgi:hypothetical protein
MFLPYKSDFCGDGLFYLEKFIGFDHPSLRH